MSWAIRDKLSRGMGFWVFGVCVAVDGALSLSLHTARVGPVRMAVVIAEYSLCVTLACIAAYGMRRGRGVVLGTVLVSLIGYMFLVGFPLILLARIPLGYHPPPVIWVCHAAAGAAYVLAWVSVVLVRQSRRKAKPTPDNGPVRMNR